MGEVAERTYVSKVTLTRFAQSLGYSGWPPFASDFVAEARYLESQRPKVDPNVPFSRDNTTAGIVSALETVQVEAIRDAAGLLEESVLEEVADLVMRSLQVALFGNSPNRFLAELFRRKMLAIGKVCTAGAADEGKTIAMRSARSIAPSSSRIAETTPTDVP